LDYAVEKGVNVFMEKSFAPDFAGLHQMLRASEVAEAKNLKISTGLMCRHSVARQALIERIREGEMGELQLIRAYRLDSGAPLRRRDTDTNELLWQIGRPGAPHFLWVSSGWYIDWLIHQIDECCWLKDAWPVVAEGLGGRNAGSTDCGQNFDNFSVEYTFADGAKALVFGRRTPNCHDDFATYAHGTRCAAQFSGTVHKGTVHLYKDQRISRDNISWSALPEEHTPWDAEWHVLLDAIRNDRPHNETRRSVYSNAAAIMGRAAVHSGQKVTWDEAMNSRFAFCTDLDRFDYYTPPPVHEDADGRYPVPVPGVWSEV
jgi:predicted dehydrogenase